ncbi:MAG: DUF342 domain-containing protein, partial [Alphaproteobacteria bacterium]|nr:DUF342 domain-containing protein [Alphaproteobacteria bacterium]
MHAQLFIDPEVTDVTADQCLTALRDAGLAIDEAIEAQVNAALAARAAEPDPADQAHEADPAADGDDDHPPTQPTLCLEGRPVVHGEDGRLEWAEGCDPERAAAESNGRVDFYNLCRYVTVSKDQQIARLVAPTDGRAGHDLRGNTLQPRRGEPAPVKADTASVKVDDAGTCTALIDGVLHFDAQQISISPVLTVRGHVDFSTGNLRFDGDVLVDKGVRDRFEVQASGDVETGELIEAAVIRAGRDLRARGGVASKEAGELRVGRDLTARYLDGVRGEIGRDAYTEREIIQCRLTVGRELNVSSGAIIGGACTVAGPVRAATLGSTAAMPTTLVLGSVPAAERLIATLDRKLGELDCDKDAENVESRRSLLKHKRDQLLRWWDAMRR